MIRLHRIKSSNRICQIFPWLAPEGRPWSDSHERVIIPLSEDEKKGSKKKCHIQVVRKDNLELIRENRMQLTFGERTSHD